MKVSYEQYHAFSAPLEGRVATMYCDCKGLITTGVGNLINTLASAAALPWLLADGSKASTSDVADDWNLLHANAMHYAALKFSAYAKQLRCHLSEDGIDELVRHTLALNEAVFRKRYAAWDSFPADAQLAIMSEAWAVGAAFWTTPHPGFTNLDRCIAAQDWEGCVASCPIRTEGNPGVVPRNAKNKFCFHNASLVKTAGADVDVLHWPNVTQPDGVPIAGIDAALAAKADAEIQLAAWHALETCPYTPPGAGAAVLADEGHDTDPAPPPGEGDA